MRYEYEYISLKLCEAAQKPYSFDFLLFRFASLPGLPGSHLKLPQIAQSPQMTSATPSENGCWAVLLFDDLSALFDLYTPLILQFHAHHCLQTPLQ